MVGDDLAIILFLLSLGFAIMLTLVGVHGWRHKGLVGTLWTLAIGCFALAISWYWLKESSSFFISAVRRVATEPMAYTVFALALAVILAIQRRSKTVKGSASASHESSTSKAIPDRTSESGTANADANGRLLKDTTIEWSGGDRVIFKGIAIRSGEKLRVDLEVWYLGGYHPAGRPYVLSGGSFGAPKSLEIGFVEWFARGQQIPVTLAMVTEVEGNQHLFQWGDEKYGHEKTGVTSGTYFGRIIISEVESYPFMVIGIGQPGKANVPVILSPNLITEISTHL